MENDTICAVATAPGGAIGIVRLSGREAFGIAGRVCSRQLQGMQPNRAFLTTLRNGEGAQIDDALVTMFRAPRSYTGEDCVEFSCHGSPYILQSVVGALIEAGARQAGPGEFTQRAFMNHKLDLAQAEAVADLIATRTASQHRMALSGLRGDLSRVIDDLHDRLLRLCTLMELELDFSDHEDVEFADRAELKTLCDQITGVIRRLTDTFATGNAIREGVRVAIAGPANAGKSTLLNRILHAERAIVSPIAGTTRDTIEDTFAWQGITFRFIDTAGLRPTDDEIERIGIDRAHEAIRNAHIIYYMVEREEDIVSLPHTDKPHIALLNKCDLRAPQEPRAVSRDCPTLSISALTGEGLDALEEWTCRTARDVLHIDAADLVVGNLRHQNALTAALTALTRVGDGLNASLPTDLLTQDLRDAITSLATITHRTITPDAVLHSVWENFCVGK